MLTACNMRGERPKGSGQGTRNFRNMSKIRQGRPVFLCNTHLGHTLLSSAALAQFSHLGLELWIMERREGRYPVTRNTK